jgi:hypothetical protein
MRYFASLLLLFFLSAQASAQDRPWVPQDLKPWEGWVLYGQEHSLCPPLAGDPAHRQCLFPTRLSFIADGSGGTFTTTWRVFAAQNIPLPVAPGLWPATVKLNGHPAAVIDQGGTPTVRLEPGEHQITGQLPWKRRPKAVRIAPQTGVLELLVDGVPVTAPKLGPEGNLDISGQSASKAPEDSVSVKVFRLLRDGVPMTVTTLARLEVSGRARTIVLDGLLPEGTLPMAVNSPVQVGFGPAGQVMAQAGAGRYDLEITSRFAQPGLAFGPAITPFGREVWAFAADPALRELQLRGLSSIDPQTTDLPDAWKKYPAYLADTGATLAMEVIRRGESGPRGDDLHIKRTFWLDFDGSGATAQDHVTGTMRSGWSLTMLPPGELGRAALPGKDLPLVLLGKEKLSGVELREASVNLTAESRYRDVFSPLPALGWSKDASSLSAEINLPPGWRLLHAAGPDTVSHSWVSGWNLMNIFLTLFMALVAWKLCGLRAGLVLTGYLVLAQHEPMAPITPWLALLAVLGLAKALDRPDGGEGWKRAASGVRVLHGVVFLGLVAMSIPFALGQVRSGVYPQLEQLGPGLIDQISSPGVAARKTLAPAGEGVAPQAVPAPMAAREAKKDARQALNEPSAQTTLEQDPNSVIQTGPGVPTWRWRTVSLRWNGPVEVSQTMHLYLVPPVATSAVCFARVLLLLASLWLLANVKRLRGVGRGTLAAVAAFLVFFPAAQSFAGLVPPKEILDELRTRLTKPSDCFPNCAGVSSMAVFLDAQALRLTMETGAATRLVLPLPAVSDGWRPQSVVVDGKPAPLFAKDGGLWVLLEEGAHRVVMSGAAPAGVSFSISSAFATRMGAVDAPGWSVLGLGPDGAVEGGLKFSRLDDAGKAGKPGITAVVQPFLEVSRVLELGLTWESVTTVRRLTQTGEPVVAEVPLLQGENVVGQEVRVVDGKAVASLAAGQRQVSWRSRLDTVPLIELTASQGTLWTETWRVTSSPVWDITLSGIPVSASLDEKGRWSPMWRPWPGEKAAIAVTRPGPAPGESLTIDSARLQYTPGARLDSAVLTLSLRSALGGRHVLRLPEHSDVTGVSVAGRAVPWSGDKPHEIGLALAPGKQDIHVAWRQPRQSLDTVATPAVFLGQQAVNATVTVDMPKDRWILLAKGNTPMAPAVLIWSAVAAAALIAFVLGFVPWAPLNRWQWFLLGLGLTQVDLSVALAAVLWLLALGARRRYAANADWFWFNAIQIGLVLLTISGLSSLFEAIRTGLLGLPSMYITGNGSSAYKLIWFFDRIGDTLPVSEVFSKSLWWYRGAMLAWSLWMAISLIKWLRWGWESFTTGGAWRKRVKKATGEGQATTEKAQLREGLQPDGKPGEGKP